MRIRTVAFLISMVATAPVESQVMTRIERPIGLRVLGTILQGVTPNSGQQGQKNISVSLSGLGTHFAQGTSVADFGPGITLASPLTVTSATTATAVVNVDPAAATGYRNVTVSTGAESVTLSNGFAVAFSPDQFGKSCALASTLSFMGRGMSAVAYGRLNMAGVEDWFVVSFAPGASLTVTLKDVQPASDFDISAYSSCGTPIAATSGGIKSLVFPDSGPHTVRLRISATALDILHPGFTLGIAGN
jgi:hypothetical protein